MPRSAPVRSAPVRPVAPRAPWAGALMLLLALSLAGCGLLPGKAAASAEGTMGSRGLELKVAGATVTLPPGTVPVGTKVNIAMDDAGVPTAVEASSAAGPALLFPVSGRLTVTVAAPLAAAMTVALDVQNPESSGTVSPNAFDPGAATLALSHTAPDGAEAALVRGGWTAGGAKDGGTVSAPLLAGGVFQAVHANVPALLDLAGAAVERAIAAASPPSCLGQDAVAAGSSFSARTPKGAWACTEAAGKLLQVAVTSPVPLRVPAQQNPDASMDITEPATAGSGYFHRILQPLAEQRNEVAGSAPGVAAVYRTAAAGVESLEWELQPYPAMFLLQYLAALAEGVMDVELQGGLGSLDASRTADCVLPLLQSNRGQVALVEQWAMPFTQAFMRCLSVSLPISPRMDVLLGAVNAGPGILVDAAVERWREQGIQGGGLDITGQLQWSSYSTTLNQVPLSFSHPAAWTVMDSTVNPQFGRPHTLVVYDHAGQRKGTLTVADKEPATAQGPAHPVVLLGRDVLPGQETRAWLMDLSGQPELRAANNWSGNVRVVQSLAALGAPVPERLAPAQLEAGVRLPGQRQKFVTFSHEADFAAVDQAQAHARGAEYAAIHKMLASFTG